MSWTTPADLRAQVQKLWDKGLLLQSASSSAIGLFPLRLRLIVPTSTEMSTRFDDVRRWMADLRQNTALCRIENRNFRHSVLGNNTVPCEVWLDSVDAALALLGKQKDAKRFAALQHMTDQHQPALLPWLVKRPLNALVLFDEWPRLLAVVGWLQAHPRPGIYLRQVDAPGVDSKFIESRRSVLAELFELALPAQAIDSSASGSSQFCRRYGFREKPLRIRYRLLATDADITLTEAAFAQLNPPVSRVFITENEVNFLAFPALADSLVIFGAGYGFDVMKSAAWLQDRTVFYWGDIDTHGFAILDQLRALLPHAQSFLMDEATLLAHQASWGDEPQAHARDLSRLAAQEQATYNILRDNRLRPRLRLEQERIAFGWVQAALVLSGDLLPLPESGA